MLAFQPRGFVFEPVVCANFFTSIQKHRVSTSLLFGFVSFFRPAFFLCDFFLIRFHRSPLLNFSRSKTFCDQDSSGFPGLCDLPETFIKKRFFGRSRLRKMFFADSSWGKIVFKTYAYLFGYFLGL